MIVATSLALAAALSGAIIACGCAVVAALVLLRTGVIVVDLIGHALIAPRRGRA